MPSLSSFEHLKTLQLQFPHRAVSDPNTSVDLTPLHSLPRLVHLGVQCLQDRHPYSVAPATLHGMSGLQQLQSLHTENIFTGSGLPPALTSLHLLAKQNPGVHWHRGVRQVIIYLPLQLEAVVRTSTSKLDHAALHMPLFNNDAAQLGTIPCLQQVSSLHLHFCNDLQRNHVPLHDISPLLGPAPPPSTWFSGLGRLRTVHVSLINKTYYTPQWDLSSCSNLSSFSLEIQYGRVWPLSGIVNLSATAFQLLVRDPALNHGSCSLDCTSWTLQRADVCYNTDVSDVPGCIPTYVTEMLDMLAHTQGGPVLSVNGMSPAAAAAIAAATPASIDSSLLPPLRVIDMV